MKTSTVKTPKINLSTVLSKTSTTVTSIASITIGIAIISFAACIIKSNVADLFRKKRKIEFVISKPKTVEAEPKPAPLLDPKDLKKGGRK